MMKFLLLLLPVLLSAQSSPNDLIEWKADRRLNWDDFRGQPDTHSPNAALTSSSINVEFGYDRTSLTYKIRCRFNKLKSWGKVKTDYILAHEQGHFDIAEIHARKLHKALKAYKFNNVTVGQDVNKLYDSIIKEHQSFQLQYDAETDHSRNPAKQKEWLDRIVDNLKLYESYSTYSK